MGAAKYSQGQRRASQPACGLREFDNAHVGKALLAQGETLSNEELALQRIRQTVMQLLTTLNSAQSDQ
jgi:hypothetical protein